MDFETAKITLEEMRKAYPTATPEKKAELKAEADRIKSEFSYCRQCKEITPKGFWFCSKECQDKYWGPAIEKKASKTIKEIQLKCLEYAAKTREEKRKLNPWEKEATIEDARLIFNQK